MEKGFSFKKQTFLIPQDAKNTIFKSDFDYFFNNENLNKPIIKGKYVSEYVFSESPIINTYIFFYFVKIK